MPVLFRYFPLPDRCKRVRNRQGLSESEVRRSLERRGWTVWRGDCLDILTRVRGHAPTRDVLWRDELYPNVRKKYERLRQLLDKTHPGTSEQLSYLCAVHHGLPDFLCHHSACGFLFIECKLGHEQLSERQKACIPKLQKLGFTVEVHKLVKSCTKTRRALVDLEAGKKRVVEKQLRLTKRLLRI